MQEIISELLDFDLENWQSLSKNIKKLGKCLLDRQQLDDQTLAKITSNLTRLFFNHSRVEIHRSSYLILLSICKVYANDKTLEILERFKFEFSRNFDISRVAIICEKQSELSALIIESLSGKIANFIYAGLDFAFVVAYPEKLSGLLKHLIFIYKKYPIVSMQADIQSRLFSLFQNDSISHECLLLVALSYVVLLCAHSNSDFIKSQIIHVLTLDNSDLKFLAFTRALATFAPDEFMQMNLQNVSIMKIRVDKKLLIELLSQISLSYCMESCRSLSIRLICFETLLLLLPRLSTMSHINEELLQLVFTHWDDPVQLVHHKVKEILEILAKDECMVKSILERLSMLDKLSKMKYSFFVILIESGVPIERITQDVSTFLSESLLNSTTHSLSSKIPEMIFKILSKTKNNSLKYRFMESVSYYLTFSDSHLRKTITIYILPRLFKEHQSLKPAEYILSKIDQSCPFYLHAYLAILKVQRNMGVVLNMDEALLKKSINHIDSSLSNDALELALLSSKLHGDLSVVTINIWFEALDAHIVLDSIEERQIFVRISRSFFSRIHNNVKYFQVKDNAFATHLTNLFIPRFFKVVKYNLSISDANFSRIDISFGLISAFINVFGITDHLRDKQLVNEFTKHLKSPSNSNRNLAFDIMNRISNHFSSFTIDEVTKIGVEAKEMLSTMYRPHDLEYAAMVIYLLAKDDSDMLSHTISENIENLNAILELFSSESLHSEVFSSKLRINGHLVLSRYILKYSRDDTFLNEYTEIAKKTCEFMLPILSNSSPEGSMSDDSNLDDVTPEQQSSYAVHICWRAVKEASCLFSEIITRLADSDRADFLEDLGVFFRQLLTQIRHMGAFFSVSEPYENLCKVLYRIGKSSVCCSWVSTDLDFIQDRNSAVSITRRSAGIPLTLLAVIHAEIEQSVLEATGNKLNDKNLVWISSRPILSLTISTLLKIASQPLQREELEENKIDLPSVHAINILRTFIRDSALWIEIEPWLDVIFLSCFQGLSSPAWAIRNSSTMLYTALVNKVFFRKRTGQAPSWISFKEFFSKSKILLDYILNQLENESTGTPVYSMVLVLSYLRYTQWPEAEKEIMKLCECLYGKIKCSSDYHIRIVASTCLANLMDSQFKFKSIEEILGDLLNTSCSNELHGLSTLLFFHSRNCFGRLVTYVETQAEMGDNPSLEYEKHLSSSDASLELVNMGNLMVKHVEKIRSLFRFHPIALDSFLQFCQEFIFPSSQLFQDLHSNLLQMLDETYDPLLTRRVALILLLNMQFNDGTDLISKLLFHKFEEVVILTLDYLHSNLDQLEHLNDIIPILECILINRAEVNIQKNIWRLISKFRNVKLENDSNILKQALLLQDETFSICKWKLSALAAIHAYFNPSILLKVCEKFSLESVSEPHRESVLSIVNEMWKIRYVLSLDSKDDFLLYVCLSRLLQDDSNSIRALTRDILGIKTKNLEDQLNFLLNQCLQIIKKSEYSLFFENVFSFKRLNVYTIDDNHLKVLFDKEPDNMFREPSVEWKILQKAKERYLNIENDQVY